MNACRKCVLPALPPFSLALSLFLLATAGAAEAQSWTQRRSGRDVVADVSSRMPGASLRIECVQAKNIWLRYYPSRGWNGGLPVSVRVGDYTSAMAIDGGDGALLSNVANSGIGISGELIDAMKRGSTIVIEGPAAVRIPVAQRTFPLANAAAAIAAVEATCGRN